MGILLETLESRDTGDFPEALFDPMNPMSSLFRMGRSQGLIPEKVINEVGDADEILQGSIVYVEKIVVHKEYRGFGLGIFMLDSAVNVINSSMSLTLINPFPLQYEDVSFHDKMRPHDYPEKGLSFEADGKKIADYYKKLGFKRIGECMLGFWNGYVAPGILKAAPKLKGLIR